MNRSTLYATLIAAIVLEMIGEVPGVRANSEAALESRQVLQSLKETLDFSPFAQADMNLKEFLAFLTEKYAARGKNLPFIVDTEAFKKNHREFNIYDEVVRIPHTPKRMQTIEALRLALSQSAKPATFLIRKDTVFIVPKNDASTKELLKQKVAADFDRTPLHDALDELSALTGASIVVDGRLGEKAKKPITATLKNDVSLDAALRMLTDMADLKVVVLESGIYVTSPAGAQAMQKELEKQQVPEKRRKKKRD